MEFRILGPLEVRSEAGAVALGGIKPRAVLAMLLLHANEPVSADRLAEALWGEEAPPGAVKTVQVHVSRLRKALGDAEMVATTPAGYRLRVGPEELDVERFARLVEDGLGALADGRAERAAAVLREALGLWRGPPLADLAFEPFAQREIDRLEEQRLAALEARVEADLTVGRHAALVEELQRLVAANPIRERLAGQLMLALYRCGRQAEALEAYRGARRVLVAEVGVEPGPELRRLQEAILRQDASLEPQQAVAELPRELDAATAPPLVGRDAELAWLRERWERARLGAGALVTVIGAHGIGKSRLAAELAGEAHRLGATVLYAAGTGPAEAVLAALARAREATRSTLLVVDDADQAGADVLAELHELTRVLATVPVLTLASGEDAGALARLSADGALTLPPLDADAVRAIAVRYAPGRTGEDVPAEWLLNASGGVSRRAHELAGQWARREAALRVGAVAERAAAGRAELRSMEADLAGGVVDLQAVREHVTLVSDVEAPVVCPFKGLASFELADAQYFFGRERLVAELVARIVGAPLLGVVGPSGSGKSSVLRAGLLPALAGGVLPGSEGWTHVLIRPGVHPLRELSGALAGLGSERRLVLAVDQFEETFTACRDEDERAAFIAELVRVAREGDGPGIVVLAVRADYYGRCATYPELSNLLAANHVLVGSMRPDELRRAVKCPALRVGLLVEPELVDALVADVADEPGALPLLSTALLELWQRRDGRRLRHAAYEHTGGVRGAVARLAEDAFRRLAPAQQPVGRTVLMRLVGEGAEGAVERRRVPLAELETERRDDVARVVGLLTDSRLLTVGAGTVEIAHEAVLREWPRLRGWIEEDREGLRIQRSITSAAEEWRRLDRDEGALFQGGRLTEAIEWRARRDPPLNQLEREFLAAGEARRRAERAARRRRRGLAFAAPTTVLVASIAVALAVVFTARENDIASSRDLATKSGSLIAADPALGLAVALEAFARHDTEQAENAVRQATYAHRGTAISPANDGILFNAALSGDGQQLATTGEDGKVRIWSVNSGRLVSTIEGHAAPALAASFSPDGQSVASVSVNGEIAIADVHGGRRSVLLRLAHEDYARSLQFRPDGNSLLIGTVEGVVGLVRISDEPATLHRLGKHAERVKARFDAHGTRVVSASEDDSARIWDVAGGAAMVLKHPDDVMDASFSPDGKHVATAGADGFVRIWDASSARLVRKIHVDDGKLLSVHFSVDKRQLVIPGEDGVVRLADVRGGSPLGELKGHAGVAYDAVFVRGGNAVMSVGQDGTLRTWAPLQGAAFPLGGRDHAPNGISFSADGKHVVTGYPDGDVRVWDVATGAYTQLPGHMMASEAKYSANGTHIVSASLDGAVMLWDVERRRSRRVPIASGERYAVAVDPSGRRIAIATLDQDTVIQGPEGRDRVTLRGHTSEVRSLAFSPDGKHLVSASEDTTVRIWDAADGAQERVLRGHDKAVVYASYSRDGKRVATADTDGTVRIWPFAGGRPVVLYGHEGQVNSVEFDRSGGRVVTAGQDGTIRVWNTAGGEALVVLHRYEGGASAAAFSPDGKRVLSVGDEGVLRVSPCEVCGSFPVVLRLARSRLARTWTATERKRLLSGEG